MKLKPQRLRSCLGWFAWVFGILLVLFAISYTIDMIRLAKAWNGAYTLAAKLGYTSDRYLANEVVSDINIIPVFGACEVQVFFTTPLGPGDFAAHLEQSVAPLLDGTPTSGRNMYLQIPFIVDGNNTRQLSWDQTDTLPPVHEHYWLVLNERGRLDLTIFYSELSQANAEIKYAGRPITENVAYVGVEAGIFPIWTFITDICVKSRNLQQWVR